MTSLISYVIQVLGVIMLDFSKFGMFTGCDLVNSNLNSLL